MSRARVATASSTMVLLVIACAHHEPAAQPTTLTSGPPPNTNADPGVRLAEAVCRRTAECKHIGGADGRWRSEQGCVADLTPHAQAQLRRWSCEPAASRARFQDCLWMVAERPCDLTMLERPERLTACPENEMCPAPPRGTTPATFP